MAQPTTKTAIPPAAAIALPAAIAALLIASGCQLKRTSCEASYSQPPTRFSSLEAVQASPGALSRGFSGDEPAIVDAPEACLGALPPNMTGIYMELDGSHGLASIAREYGTASTLHFAGHYGEEMGGGYKVHRDTFGRWFDYLPMMRWVERQQRSITCACAGARHVNIVHPACTDTLRTVRDTLHGDGDGLTPAAAERAALEAAHATAFTLKQGQCVVFNPFTAFHKFEPAGHSPIASSQSVRFSWFIANLSPLLAPWDQGWVELWEPNERAVRKLSRTAYRDTI